MLTFSLVGHAVFPQDSPVGGNDDALTRSAVAYAKVADATPETCFGAVLEAASADLADGLAVGNA